MGRDHVVKEKILRKKVKANLIMVEHVGVFDYFDCFPDDAGT
jgi:hypothetical protein